MISVFAYLLCSVCIFSKTIALSTFRLIQHWVEIARIFCYLLLLLFIMAIRSFIRLLLFSTVYSKNNFFCLNQTYLKLFNDFPLALLRCFCFDFELCSLQNTSFTVHFFVFVSFYASYSSLLFVDTIAIY